MAARTSDGGELLQQIVTGSAPGARSKKGRLGLTHPGSQVTEQDDPSTIFQDGIPSFRIASMELQKLLYLVDIQEAYLSISPPPPESTEIPTFRSTTYKNFTRLQTIRSGLAIRKEKVHCPCSF
ncbi:unnamed protein product [Ranitomeya imitator]|uniref:Uncharacterized protein n=1 Tax=Ranitomeya imitator TaxID=111125 RepID=A0ABN9M6V5_9NEOB|nr:unnamed protein product [Ranitomeya imitator]